MTETPDTSPPPPGDPRVYYAAERTMLAWVRTGIAMMGFGFVVARFGLFLREVESAHLSGAGVAGPSPRGGLSMWVGTTLIVLGVLVNLLAAARHFRFARQFRRGLPPTLRGEMTGISLAVVLGVIGVAMAVYLLFVR